MRIKKIVAASVASAMLMAGQASADSGITVEECHQASNLAKEVMTNRQVGISMSSQYQVASTLGPLSAMVSSMVKGAYEYPRYSTNDYQQGAINDFSNHWFALCIDLVE